MTVVRTKKTPAQRCDEADVAASDRLVNAVQELLGAQRACKDRGLDVYLTLDAWIVRATTVSVRRSFKTGRSTLVRFAEWDGVTRKETSHVKTL